MTIQEILGHKSLNSTLIYTHVRRDHLQTAGRVLDLLPLGQLRGAQRTRTGRTDRTEGRRGWKYRT